MNLLYRLKLKIGSLRKYFLILVHVSNGKRSEMKSLFSQEVFEYLWTHIWRITYLETQNYASFDLKVSERRPFCESVVLVITEKIVSRYRKCKDHIKI